MSKAKAKVIQLRPVVIKATKASERKWTKAVMERGFCVVPSLLLRAQRRLGLSAEQLAIVMHLADHWWDAERKPHPGKKRLAERLSVSTKTIQRRCKELENAGLVKRNPRSNQVKGKLSNEYDLSGLVARLVELEPEFRKVDEEATAKKRATERRRVKEAQGA
jgi:DNA-binding MarR family transcriptional regulator